MQRIRTALRAGGRFDYGEGIEGELVTLPPSLVRTEMVGHRGGGVTHVRPVVSTFEWKPLLSLPSPGKPEKHGRDLRYQRRVQRKPVLRPLESAERFLEALP